MSVYRFGLGAGHLPRRANTIAKRHGAHLVNYCDPGCRCGHGCADNCPQCRRHWFAGPNLGAPHDRALADAVLADLAKAGLKGGAQ